MKNEGRSTGEKGSSYFPSPIPHNLNKYLIFSLRGKLMTYVCSALIPVLHYWESAKEERAAAERKRRKESKNFLSHSFGESLCALAFPFVLFTCGRRPASLLSDPCCCWGGGGELSSL